VDNMLQLLKRCYSPGRPERCKRGMPDVRLGHKCPEESITIWKIKKMLRRSRQEARSKGFQKSLFCQ
jgi:hypothetical protein